jgi:anthranilate synthase component 1
MFLFLYHILLLKNGWHHGTLRPYIGIGVFLFYLEGVGKMKISPNYLEFKKRSLTNKNQLIYLEMPQGGLDILKVYLALCKDSPSFILESVDANKKWGRYSYIGRKPFMEVKGYGSKVIFKREDGSETEEEGDVLELIRNEMDEYKLETLKEDIPDLIGGGVGYISYDTIRNYERLKTIKGSEIDIPDIYLLFTKVLIVFDHFKNVIFIIVNINQSNYIETKEQYMTALKTITELHKEIQACKSNIQEVKKPHRDSHVISNVTKDEFISNVKKAKEHIKNGDIFQVVLSQRFAIETQSNPFNIYINLREVNPSPYMFFIDYGDFQLIGSSPELLVKVKGNSIETCPIAGTRPRGKSIEEDKILSEELSNDSKEISEHVMLVDLARNDVGKISEFGSVIVDKFLEVHYYSHVMHLVSYVKGILKEGLTAFDAIKSCLPAGTVSGAPKVRAMEIIDQIEKEKRGVYAGGVGYFSFNGNSDFCIAIRTIVLYKGKAYIQGGAGIVADSEPESEYNETQKKAEALIKTIKKSEEVCYVINHR